MKPTLGSICWYTWLVRIRPRSQIRIENVKINTKSPPPLPISPYSTINKSYLSTQICLRLVYIPYLNMRALNFHKSIYRRLYCNVIYIFTSKKLLPWTQRHSKTRLVTQDPQKSLLEHAMNLLKIWCQQNPAKCICTAFVVGSAGNVYKTVQKQE